MTETRDSKGWKAWVATVSLVLASMLIPPSLVDAESGSTALQWNLWGNKGIQAVFNTGIASEALAKYWSVGGTGANPFLLAISNNEVCSSILPFLASNFFASGGYQLRAQWAKQYVSPQCGSFGNTVALKSTALLIPETVRPFVNQGSSASHSEYKGLVCMQGNYFGVVACSAHMQSSNQPVANAQAWEYSVEVNSFASAASQVIVMGDFNMSGASAGSTMLTGWYYPYFLEADASGYWSGSVVLGKRATTDDGQAIDYIFRRSPNSRSATAVINNAVYSDHHSLTMKL